MGTICPHSGITYMGNGHIVYPHNGPSFGRHPGDDTLYGCTLYVCPLVWSGLRKTPNQGSKPGYSSLDIPYRSRCRLCQTRKRRHRHRRYLSNEQRYPQHITHSQKAQVAPSSTTQTQHQHPKDFNRLSTRYQRRHLSTHITSSTLILGSVSYRTVLPSPAKSAFTSPRCQHHGTDPNTTASAHSANKNHQEHLQTRPS